MPEVPPTQDDAFTGAVVFFFIATYFCLAGFALWYVFTHL